jgi:hypothetical protein
MHRLKSMILHLADIFRLFIIPPIKYIPINKNVEVSDSDDKRK